jgi:tripartite-type tricarboxylate transporter receptor subunit TctC
LGACLLQKWGLAVLARVVSLAVTLLALGVASNALAEDFYQGKTLSIVVGYAAGGGYDTNARLLARHISGHIPGNPAIVVVNMPGAGSLKSLEYIQRTAPKDGTTLELFDFTQITNSLLTPKKVPIDFRRFKWVGSITQDLAACYVWHTVKAKTLAEVQALPVVEMGRTNPGSSSDIEQKIFRKLFDVKVHSVAGYKGSSEAFLAVERGELNGGCITWASLPANWVTDKLITPVLRLSNATALGLPASVPSAYDVAANDRDRKIMRVLLASGEVGKPFVFVLAVPDDRVATMRGAFAATVQDPKFLADAEKLRQPVTPTLGEEAEKIVDEVYATPADIIQAARAVASDD